MRPWLAAPAAIPTSAPAAAPRPARYQSDKGLIVAQTGTSPLARAVLQRVAAWNQAHPNQRIDPQAELAVAAQEGLSGGIGDGGHAFGPNQLNNAGGVLTGKFRGLNPSQINQWAWTPQGIDYALSGVAKAAGGLSGAAAVRAIVQQFERPANPSGETARALQAYGLPVSGGTAPAGSSAGRVPASRGGQETPPSQAAPQDHLRQQLGLALIQALQDQSSGQPPDLGSVFNLAKTYQQVRGPLSGGTALQMGAGLKL